MVAVDYFTKWMEAELLATITEAKITNIIRTNLVCRFGIPDAIVSKNRKRFDNPKFNGFCSRLEIKHLSASPTHPQANKKVEAINKIIKRDLKLRVDGPRSYSRCCGRIGRLLGIP